MDEQIKKIVVHTQNGTLLSLKKKEFLTCSMTWINHEDIMLSGIVQSLSCVQLFATPWTAALQGSLSFTISLSLLKLMPTESVIPSNYLILIWIIFLCII